jgi:hypothetical protein
VTYGDQFNFEGIGPIEQRFLARVEGAVYLVVKDRTVSEHEETLGRLDLTPEDVAPYLPDAQLASAMVADEPWDDDGPSEAWEPESEPDKPSPVEMMKAALRWVREVAIRNTTGESHRRFRVKLYAAKAIDVLASGQFVCRNDRFDLTEYATPATPPPIPAPTFEEAEGAGAVKGLKALGDYYAQWGAIVLGSVGQLQGVNNAMLARLHRQLQESRDQVDQLVASILEFRVKEIEVQEERLSDEREGDARTALAREALGQLGQAANAFLAGRGLSPESVELLGMLGASPDLMAALKDPKVRALMQEPDNLKSLAEMLRQAGSQAQAANEAATPPPTSPAAA